MTHCQFSITRYEKNFRDANRKKARVLSYAHFCSLWNVATIFSDSVQSDISQVTCLQCLWSQNLKRSCILVYWMKSRQLQETFPNMMSRNIKTLITTKFWGKLQEKLKQRHTVTQGHLYTNVLTWTWWFLNPTAALSIGKRNWIRILSHTLLLRLTPHAKQSLGAVFAWAEVIASLILTISS